MEPVRLADDVVELAAPSTDDIDTIETLCQDPDVQRWTAVPSPYRRADAESFVGAWVTAGWATGRGCTWAIRTDGALVGMVGLRLQPERSAEVGYWLGAEARGRGLLHRSLQLALGYGLDPGGLGLDRVEWHCVAGNWASWRAAWRVGFTFEGSVRGAALIRGERRDDWVATLLRDDPREPRAPWPATTVRVPAAPPEAAPRRSLGARPGRPVQVPGAGGSRPPWDHGAVAETTDTPTALPRVTLADVVPPIALGPLDGRYRAAVAPLVDHLSEPALNRERLLVEVEWVIHLSRTGAVPGAPRLSAREEAYLRRVVETFGAGEIARLGAIEKVTVHDVKAVEYFLKEHVAAAPDALGPDTVLPAVSELVHFACTSEDVNNLSYALMVRGAVTDVWLPAARALVAEVGALAREHRDVPLLARTHGQPATPTTLGKELAVLAHRLGRQVRRIEAAEYLGKLNGATGTYGAHVAAVPGTDWPEISRTFVEGLGLTWNPLTTQIESHDWQAELYADVARFNRVLHNLSTDVWTYISLGVFVQIPVAGATGSSTMPHKVNPIRFENAEANLELSSALLDTLASTLVTSRLQRDLTDSTTQRNIGPAFGHSLLAIDNVRRGLRALAVDRELLERELDANWEVLGEPVQSAMRAASVAGVTGMENPYERLKELTRGKRLTADDMREFIGGLGLPDDVAARLAALTPATYTGLAGRLVDHLRD